MKTNILEKLQEILSSLMHPGINRDKLFLLEEFMSNNKLSTLVKDDRGTVYKDPEELKRLQNRNPLIDWALTYLDTHPFSETPEIAEPIRAVVWKCAGIKCDDFSKLRIGKAVRFYNPENITLATGGFPIDFVGLRSVTFLDGRCELIIFGTNSFGAGVKIFTHAHSRDNTNLPHYVHDKRIHIPSIIYPDCAIGEDCHILGNIQMRTVVADMSVTQHKKCFPPYSVIGGIGRAYRVIRYTNIPKPFPPEYLVNLLENVKSSYRDLGSLLAEYYEFIKELSETSGDRAKEWVSIREKVKRIEEEYHKRMKL